MKQEKKLNLIEKYKIFVVGIQLLISGFWFGCSHGQKAESPPVRDKKYAMTLSNLLSHSVPEIGVNEVYASREKFILLDTREKNEFQLSRIEHAIWVGFDDFNLERVRNLDKNKPVVCYCSVGYRSEKVCEKLKQAGFRDVKNLYGSIFEWVNQGYPLVDQNGRPTDSLHVYSRSWGKFVTQPKIRKVYK